MYLKYKHMIEFLYLVLTLGLETNFCEAISYETRKDPLLPKTNKKEIRPHLKTVHSVLDGLLHENEPPCCEISRKENEPPKTSVMLGDYGKYSFGLGKGCSRNSKCNIFPENTNGPSLAVPFLFIKGDNTRDIPAAETEQTSLHS